MQRAQGGRHAVIDVCVVELVLPIVGEKKVDGALHEYFVVGTAQRAPHQHGGAIPDVGSDHLAGQFRPVQVAQHGVDRVDEVEARVNKGAVEVEDQELEFGGIEGAVGADHL